MLSLSSVYSLERRDDFFCHSSHSIVFFPRSYEFFYTYMSLFLFFCFFVVIVDLLQRLAFSWVFVLTYQITKFDSIKISIVIML